MLSREVTTLECVHHPNILRLFEVVETLGRVHLVTEWIRGGELYHRITHGGPLKELHAAPLYRQLLLAVKHMHNLGFVHRDIKAENVLMVTEERIKLADFGFSTQLINGSQQHLDTFCGSPPYAAPELFSDDHYIGAPVDVWALGVLIYFMVVGNMPFRAPTVPALRAAVLKGDYCLPSHLSLPCTRLIQRILVHTPSRRPTVDQMLESQWVNHPKLPLDLTVPNKQPATKKSHWFPRSRSLARTGRERHIEMTNLTPIPCNTKRASSIFADNFLCPIDITNIDETFSTNVASTTVATSSSTTTATNIVKSHRKSLFSGTLKKKIGPMEENEKGKMFKNRSNSSDIKTIDGGGDNVIVIKNGGTSTMGATATTTTTTIVYDQQQRASGGCDQSNPFDEEQGSFVILPTCTNDLSHLHQMEIEARLILHKLGITSELLCRSIDSGPRSDIIGAYRIIVHRLQKQAWLNKQTELVAKEEAAAVRPKNNRTCAIL